MNAQSAVPSAIRERWGDWHPEERQWLADFREAMRTRHPSLVQRIILFGSRARGDFRNDSDIDVLVIVGNDGEWLKREIGRLGVRLSMKSTVAIPSVAVRTQGEWQRLARLESPFQAEVEQQGVDAL